MRLTLPVHRGEIRLSTRGHTDIKDITPQLRRIIEESGVSDGIACIANPGSTAGITTIEYEPGAVADLAEALDKLAPEGRRYRHDATWGDGNGFAHLRSALTGTSASFPVIDGQPVLGTWQQVIFLDFDNRERERTLHVVVLGE